MSNRNARVRECMCICVFGDGVYLFLIFIKTIKFRPDKLEILVNIGLDSRPIN